MRQSVSVSVCIVHVPRLCARLEKGGGSTTLCQQAGMGQSSLRTCTCSTQVRRYTQLGTVCALCLRGYISYATCILLVCACVVYVPRPCARPRMGGGSTLCQQAGRGQSSLRACTCLTQVNFKLQARCACIFSVPIYACGSAPQQRVRCGYVAWRSRACMCVGV